MDSLVEVRRFFSRFPKLSVGTDIALFSPYDKCDYLYYLKRGLVRQLQVSQSGSIFCIQLYRAGDFFPLPNLLSGSNVLHYFETQSSCLLYKIPASAFLDYLHSHPSIQPLINARLSSAVLGLVSRLETQCLGNALSRIGWLLLVLNHKFGHRNQISLPFTHREMASWTGLTRETASLNLEWLRRHHIIKYYRHRITIRDLPRLQQLTAC